MFQTYDWPGNIRELENMIKRLVILQDEQLVFAEIDRNMQRIAKPLPQRSRRRTPPQATGCYPPRRSEAPTSQRSRRLTLPGRSRRRRLPAAPSRRWRRAAAMKAERALIEKTLNQVHWNRRKASQILGVSYKTLLNKIKECGISRD